MFTAVSRWALARTRQAALTQMYEHHPERFVHKPPTVKTLPVAVEINPVAPDGTGSNAQYGHFQETFKEWRIFI